jgi:hypothetical protein
MFSVLEDIGENVTKNLKQDMLHNIETSFIYQLVEEIIEGKRTDVANEEF